MLRGEIVTWQPTAVEGCTLSESRTQGRIINSLEPFFKGQQISFSCEMTGFIGLPNTNPSCLQLGSAFWTSVSD